MRLCVALDRYLQHCKLERDFTPRSLDSYYRILAKLVDAYPAETRIHEFDGREGKARIQQLIAEKWGHTSARNRGKVISYFHSWFAWMEAEDLIENDRVRQIRRPPARRADVYRPPTVDRELAFRATRLHERAPFVLMYRLGLRASAICGIRWRDLDLRTGHVHFQGKGGHRDVLPIPSDTLDVLRTVYAELTPDPEHHVFTVEREEWLGPRRIRRTRDPSRPAATNSLWGMVQRVCARAGVKPFGSHALRHGFATDFLKATERDAVSLQKLMRHASIETTMGYVDEMEAADLETVLERVTKFYAPDNTGVGDPEGGICARHDSNVRPGASGSESAAEPNSGDDLDPGSGSQGGAQGAL